MERMPDFRLSRPASYAEAAALLAGDTGARLLAGGTDLVPNLRRGLEAPSLLVDLGRVQGADELEFGASELRLGAGVTLARLAADPRIAGDYCALGELARRCRPRPPQRRHPRRQPVPGHTLRVLQPERLVAPGE